jgi:hypothetical protein
MTTTREDTRTNKATQTHTAVTGAPGGGYLAYCRLCGWAYTCSGYSHTTACEDAAGHARILGH